jgi:hypothetical protein
MMYSEEGIRVWGRDKLFVRATKWKQTDLVDLSRKGNGFF